MPKGKTQVQAWVEAIRPHVPWIRAQIELYESVLAVVDLEAEIEALTVQRSGVQFDLEELGRACRVKRQELQQLRLERDAWPQALKDEYAQTKAALEAENLRCEVRGRELAMQIRALEERKAQLEDEVSAYQAFTRGR